MPASKRHALEIGEDSDFQEKSWQAQRIGFGGLLVFVALAALGVFGGGGPWATVTRQSQALTATHDRFVRCGTASEIALTVPGGPSGSFDVRIASPFLQAFRIDHILPPPLSIAATPDGVIYRFEQPTTGRGQVWITVTPKRPGRTEFALQAAGEDLRLTLLAYP